MVLIQLSDNIYAAICGVDVLYNNIFSMFQTLCPVNSWCHWVALIFIIQYNTRQRFN